MENEQRRNDRKGKERKGILDTKDENRKEQKRINEIKYITWGYNTN